MFFSYPCSTEMTALPNFFCSPGMGGGQFSTPTTQSVNVCVNLALLHLSDNSNSADNF